MSDSLLDVSPVSSLVFSVDVFFEITPRFTLGVSTCSGSASSPDSAGYTTELLSESVISEEMFVFVSSSIFIGFVKPLITQNGNDEFFIPAVNVISLYCAAKR